MRTTAAREASSQGATPFEDTLHGFGLLLAGRFRREPDGTPTVLGRALERIAQVNGMKPVPVRRLDGETDSDYLDRAAAACQLRPRRLSTGHGAPPDGDLPILAFHHDGAPVVLVPRARGGFMVEDPASDAMPRRMLAPDWLGYRAAFAFHRCLPPGKLTYRGLMGFGLRPAAGDIGLLAACGLMGALLGMLPPLITSTIADIGVHTADVSFLLQLMAVLLAGLVGEVAFFVIGGLTGLRVQGRASLALHAAMVDRLLRLPAPALRRTSSLILATQMETVEKLRRSVLAYASAAAMAAANGLTASAILLVQSPAAGLLAGALTCLLSLLAAILGWAQYRAIYEGERMDVVVLAFAYDLVRVVPVLRAGKLQRHAFVKWGQNFLAFQSRLMRSARISNWLSTAEPVWEALVLAAAFAALAAAGAFGSVSAGSAVVFVLALGKLVQAGKSMSHAAIGAAKLLPMARLARPLLDQPVEPMALRDPLPALSGAMEMRGVYFFHGARPVLTDVSFSIEAGSLVGITGPSGAGKSTLLGLLLGMEKPQGGHVLLDGHDLDALDRRQVLRRVGTVTQGGRLLPGTIFDNVRRITDITHDEAWEFLAQAGVADEIRQLPMEIQTIVTEAGAGLALGQVQRILIAAALAQRPAILVLDEAMSALEPARQNAILARLATTGMTRIIVTHQQASLADADQILRLDQGRITAWRPSTSPASASPSMQPGHFAERQPS